MSAESHGMPPTAPEGAATADEAAAEPESWLALRFDESALREDPIVGPAVAPLPENLQPPVGLRQDVRQIAARGWADRTRSEYAGVMIVRHFHGLLVDLNAPADLQEVALLMLLQEQQHARYCAEALRSLSGESEVSIPRSELRIERTDAPLVVQLWQMILGTYCCGEVVAHGLIRHAVRALPDSGYRDILRRISSDEVLHARIGWALLDSARRDVEPRWLPYPGDGWVKQFVAAQREAMAARDVVEPDEAALFGDAQAAEQLVAVGIPPSSAFKQAYLDSLARDVDKGFKRFGVDVSS